MRMKISATLSDNFIATYKEQYFISNFQEEDISSQILKNIDLRRKIAKDIINSIKEERPKEIFRLLDPLYSKFNNFDNSGFIQMSISNKDDVLKDILDQIEDSIISDLQTDEEFRKQISIEIFNGIGGIKMTDINPVIFISYSHDNKDHEDWVENLCKDLADQGIQPVFDKYDTSLGSNLAKFMESCIDTDRVICVCTPEYVRKADEGIGGAGYETTILTHELLKDSNNDRIIPIIRQFPIENDKEPVPKFLFSRMYHDMSSDDEHDYKECLDELIRDIHRNKKQFQIGEYKYTKNQIKNDILRDNLLSKLPKIEQEKVIDIVLNELQQTPAYSYIPYGISGIYEKSKEVIPDIEEREIIIVINKLEEKGIVETIRSKTIGLNNRPQEIKIVSPIFKEDIDFVESLKQQLIPTLQSIPEGKSITAKQILLDLYKLDIEEFNEIISYIYSDKSIKTNEDGDEIHLAYNLLLFALMDLHKKGLIKLYLDKNIGSRICDISYCRVVKI